MTTTAPERPPATPPADDRPTELPPVEPRPIVSETPPERPAAKRPTTRAGRRAQAAAKKATPKAETKPSSTAKPAPRRASLEVRLAGSIAGLGTSVVIAGAMTSPAVQADGMLIVEHSGNIATALDKLAKDNPNVAVALERMLTAGAYAGLITALTPVLLGIAANHGALPPGVLAMLTQQPEADQAPAGD